MTATSTIIRKKTAPPTNSVVTPERYAEGITGYAAWMAKMEKNQDNFERHYKEWVPEMSEIARLKELVEQYGVKALLLGEDFCPDVWRGVPVIARMSEMTGMEVRYFLRDQNKDIMAEFLKDGEFESVPAVVFYDRDHHYLGHWIERADLANDQMPLLRKVMEGVERDTPEWATARAKYQEMTWEYAEGWRDAQLTETIALLEEALEGVV